MFEFWRNWRKTAAEKQQEAMNAYLDDALPPAERQRFEQEMAQDDALRREVDSVRLLRAQLRQLPSRPVPRSFTLDPAVYGRPAPQPLFQFYPALRTATVLTGLFLIAAISLNLFTGGAAEMAQDLAMAPQAESAVVETTRIVTEVTSENEELAADEEAAEPASGIQSYAADDAAAEADIVEEEAAGEAAAADMPAAEEPAAAEPAAAAPEAETAADTAVSPTPAPAATLAPPPTPTTSTPPRIAEGSDTADSRPIDATAVPTAQPIPASPNWVAIGIVALLLVFLLLLGTTLWVRRQI